MARILSPEEVDALLRIRTPHDAQRFLQQIMTAVPDQWKWRPLGNHDVNASSVEVLTDPEPALVERIMNGIDAVLELRHAEIATPEGTPCSPRDAVEQWFGIPGGSLERDRDRRIIDSLAPKIRVDVYESGEPKVTTVVIADEGIGQHPDDLDRTILSLQGSNKARRPYLCGTYGQGGSTTFAWCEYTVIISRRRPEYASGKTDAVGWTIVRRHDDANLKVFIYQYLVNDDSTIPRFPASWLPKGFTFSTYIAHIDYDMGRLQSRWSKVGYRYLNSVLFDPILPYAINDHRDPKPQDRYMYGSRARLDKAPLEYSNEYIADLREDGILIVRYWVFRERGRDDSDEEDERGVRIDSYLDFPGSRRNVVVTLNGQRHAYMERAVLRDLYGLLSEALLVQVDCDKLSPPAKKGLFASTRAGMRAGARRLALVQRVLREALLSDKELRRLETERARRQAATVDEKSAKKVKRLLDQMISLTRPSTGPGAQREGSDGHLGGGQERYKPKDPPTFLRFADEKHPIRLEPGHWCTVDLVTDAPEDILTRRSRRASLSLEVMNGDFARVQPTRFNRGRMCLVITALENAPIGSACQIRAILDMPGGVYLVAQRWVNIAPPPPPYIGNDPPTRLIILAKGPTVRLRRGSMSQVSVETDCVDVAFSRPTNPMRLEAECSVPGVKLSGLRGPRRGRIDLFLRVPDPVSEEPGRVHSITVRLRSSTGVILQDCRPCIVVEPPPEDREPKAATRPEANYRLVDVWQHPPPAKPDAMTWAKLGWTSEHVGTYKVSRDEAGRPLLLLYINMDNQDLRRERERYLKAQGENSARRLDIRYMAYVGYHLWLHAEPMACQGERIPSELGSTKDAEDELFDEMERVCKTILLAMRSEADLFREEALELEHPA